MKSLPRNFLVTIVLLSATLFAARLSERRPSDYLARPLESIGAEVNGWRATGDQTLGASVLRVLLPTSYLSRSYKKDNLDLGLFIAFYAQQRAGESMHSPKHCLPGSGWEIWNYDSVSVPVAGSSPVRINKYSINNTGRRLLMFYWYQSKHRIIASEYLGKLLLVEDALLDGHTAASIVRITVPDVPRASDEAETFASNLIPQVQRCFGN